MVSFSARYLAGEHERVWADLRALGPVPAPLATDVAAVAAETMRRVAGHVARIAAALPEHGFVPADALPLHAPPTSADHTLVDQVADEVGGLPAAFHACLQMVGGVWLLGDCPALEVYYHHDMPVDPMPPGYGYPDPLCLPDVHFVAEEWAERREHDPGWRPDGFRFPFAPDELHKANISGQTHDLCLPDRVADPVIHRVAGRPGITLVNYLRVSIAWGGFPGWSFCPEQAPAALGKLRTKPDF
jgi:hypothetical protein